MKALNLHAINDLRYENVKLPKRKSDEVTLLIKAAGICGSDIPRIFTKGTYHFPTIPGHELSGIIVDADESSLIGRKAAVFPLIPCRSCEYCQIGKYELCNHYDYYGSRRNGGYAEYLNVKIRNLAWIPENVSYEEAAMCEPASVALHALRRGKVKMMDTIAIWGIGPIGLLLAKWAVAIGVKDVILVARNNIKKDAAERLGFIHSINSSVTDPINYIYNITGGHGADVCVEGTGNSEAMAYCLRVCRKMGTVICMGNPNGDVTLDQDSYWAILRKQLNIVGTWNSSFTDISNDWRDTLDAMASKRIVVTDLITKKYNLKDFKKAFDDIMNPNVYTCKVMFINGGENKYEIKR